MRLNRSRGPGAFRGEQNLWENDLHRIYQLIEQQLATLKKVEPNESAFDRRNLPHLSIAIFGPSGSGKSSLLRTLADDINRDEHKDRLCPSNIADGVAAMKVLDPTTWAETDQFIYAFLARALEEEVDLDKRFERGEPQGLSSLQLAFQNVNEYLRVIDDPPTPHEHDPLGLSLQRLERHTSGLRLGKALSGFVDSLAETLSKKIVLLPVDDLDMAPTHLVQSLQTYQSYLMHPCLVPVFSFTDRMPEELLEAYFDRRLGNGAHRNARPGDEQRLSVSEQLALQFLARCFPVRNRIRLGPAPARVQCASLNMEGNGEDRKIRELLVTSSFLLFGHPDKEDTHSVRSALRPSTLRRQIQVIDAMAQCSVDQLLTPQLALLADETCRSDQLALLVGGWESEGIEKFWEKWKRKEPGTLLREEWPVTKGDLFDSKRGKAFSSLANAFLQSTGLSKHGDATWATVFNTATWSLLNVHRDALRELGLFLEDLYSWSPKELRSVVLGRILAQDRATRRTVVDRWFNRSDYRRSQVLSLLAANVFRPWMPGEEPFGDDDAALHAYRRDKDRSEARRSGNASDQDQSWSQDELARRLTFPATQGLLWFLQVTMGFYLPQIMARNWSESHDGDETLQSRMTGNGWDLQQAPINAMRIAEARYEIFSFGMVFLDPCAFSDEFETELPTTRPGLKEASALLVEAERATSKASQSLNKAIAEEPKEEETRKIEKDRVALDGARDNQCTAQQDLRRSIGLTKHRLLLRIWSCYGLSRGRFWAAVSVWRGLGFIGRVLEVWNRYGAFSRGDQEPLERELQIVVRAHCQSGTVPGSMLDRGADEGRLSKGGFTMWDAGAEGVGTEIDGLVKLLVLWLEDCREHRVLPYPAGDRWVDWSGCFLRRVHGEYILGGLWPRLNAVYLAKEHQSSKADSNAVVRAWCEVILEYWRGCPAILYLLMSCPVFLNRSTHQENDGSAQAWRYRLLRPSGEDSVSAKRLHEAFAGLELTTENELTIKEGGIERVAIDQFNTRVATPSVRIDTEPLKMKLNHSTRDPSRVTSISAEWRTSKEPSK